MSTSRRVMVGLALALAGSVAACAVGPNYKRPPLPVSSGYGPAAEAGSGPALVAGADVPERWWEAFKSEPLDRLVDEALRANPTIDQARATLRAAHELVLAQRGAYYPQVAASISPSRQKFATDLASPLASGNSFYTLTTSQVSVSYTPDIFGANRRAVESLKAQEDAQRFELEAARLTIASNTALAAIQDAALRAQIAATQTAIESQRKTLESFRKQRALGQASAADVAAQETQLAQAEATLPPLEKALRINRDLLASLIGRTPQDAEIARFDLNGLTLPPSMPLSLPARLVDQRPDVRMAEAQLHAASADVGVALAARLPNIDIEGNLGSAAIGSLFSTATNATFWNITGTVTQPIFQGGTLLHRQRAAEAQFDAAKAQYRATVIGAFQNTADVLHALKADADATAATATAMDAADRSLAISRRQFDLGDVSAVTVLAAEQADAQARLALVQAQGQQYADAVALFQALGGGWWNRTK